jgi:hypothetical protein
LNRSQLLTNTAVLVSLRARTIKLKKRAVPSSISLIKLRLSE